MTLESITAFFGWATVLNFALLVLSTIGLIAMRDFVARVHGRMFGLESADLSRAYFQYLAHYKIAIIVSSLVPYLALRMIA